MNKPPFPSRLIGDANARMWLEWLREHGAALRGASQRELHYYFKRVFGPWIGHERKEKQLVFVQELSFASEWAGCGFPQIVVGEKLFASFAGTCIPADAAPDLGLPWECFILRIPDKFQADVTLDFVPEAGAAQQFTARLAYIRVRRNWAQGHRASSVDDPNWLLSTDGRAGYEWSLVTHTMPWARKTKQFDSLSSLLEHREGPTVRVDLGPDGRLHEVGLIDEDRQSREDRVRVAMERAFAGVVLELMSPKAHGFGGHREGFAVRGAELPSGKSTFVLTRDVVVDCRDWLVNHLRPDGASRLVNVQSLVRGHWKRQPYGPQGAERKYIHVEPYWRGPEDAPIAVRAHKLNGTNGGN